MVPTRNQANNNQPTTTAIRNPHPNVLGMTEKTAQPLLQGLCFLRKFYTSYSETRPKGTAVKDRIKKFYTDHEDFITGVIAGSSATALVSLYAITKIVDNRRIKSADNFMQDDGRNVLALFNKSGDLIQVLSKTTPKP